jgi:hypothetical protein
LDPSALAGIVYLVEHASHVDHGPLNDVAVGRLVAPYRQARIKED